MKRKLIRILLKVSGHRFKSRADTMTPSMKEASKRILNKKPRSVSECKYKWDKS